MSEWISVEDRLPEMAGQNVLVYGVNLFGQHHIFMAFQGYGDFNWYTSDVTYMNNRDLGDNRLSTNWDITHWMPLPEPPENNGEGK